MKLLKKFSLGYTLQVFAIILLFGYPGGCSSFTGQKEIKDAEKGIVNKKILSPDVKMNNIIKNNDSMLLFNNQNLEKQNILFLQFP